MNERKRCTRCGKVKSLDEFHLDHRSKVGRRRNLCKACNAAATQQWRKTSERYELSRPARNLRKRLRAYGMSKEEFDEMVEAQGSRCASCGDKRNPYGRDGLFVDHDHRTGKRRALLCGQCNFAAGLLRDDVRRLVKLARYLLRWR